MENLKARVENFRFKGVLAIALVFSVMALVLLVQLMGVQVNHVGRSLELLEPEQIVTKRAACRELEQDTLLLYSRRDAPSAMAYEQFRVILDDMKLGTRAVDLSAEEMPAFDRYRLVIVLFSDLSHVGDSLMDLCRWVRDEGGYVYFPLTIDKNAYSSAIENRIGIEASYGYSMLESIYIHEGFMVGGGKAFAVADAYESARTVQLNPHTTRIHARINDEAGVPVIWEADYGEGTFVVNNFGMCDKAYRGFFAASLSLCGPVCLYPVINGSAFYLDDFPSQIPEGENEYITRDFGTSVRGFYINIWWPDMMNLSDKYGIKYTGLAIECYDDTVDGTTDATPDAATFLNLGNMLLRKGGEIGYHGYNHQPLCLANKSYREIYDYKTWESAAAMEKAFAHLVDFCHELFPGVEMAVYVPPSNLLSQEGRNMLTGKFPHIRTLSGIYLPDDVLDFALLQEFEVDERGIVDQPRIVSGCYIDDFMTMGALSELNMHYVNNHFTHPDDALDPERGAEFGWTALRAYFEEYLTWLYGSAPGLRNFTATELSGAVQRYVALAPQTRLEEGQLTLTIGNFYDEAFFMVRVNQGRPVRTQGGTLSHITGDLYLLEAEEETVTIWYK